MYHIKLFNKISESGLSHLDPADFVYSEDAAEYDGIIVRSAALHDVEFPASRGDCPRWRWRKQYPGRRMLAEGRRCVQHARRERQRRQELVLAGLFLASRDIVGGIEWAHTLKGQQGVAKLVEKGKSSLSDRRLKARHWA